MAQRTSGANNKRRRSGARQGDVSRGRTVPFDVRDHRLSGPRVAQRPTPNRGGSITPRYLVFHYTAGRSAQSAINWLTNPEAKASAHLVIARDGKVTQLAPFNVKTWHAGRSRWDGLSGLNSHSIGIEMDNAGPLSKVGNGYRAWFGKTYPESQVIHATHKLEQEPRWWHAYTEAQITVAWELAHLLFRQYDLKEVVGHEDIAPARKRDPGPAFPLDNIRAAVEGRLDEADEEFEVTASSLNIRTGPGVDYAPAGESLRRGTKVRLLEKRDRWSKVEVDGDVDLEGWVFNKFIRQAGTEAE